MKKNSNKKIPINSGNVIISDKQGNSYDFVFTDIESAKHLYISTFNYYMEKEYLDKILMNIHKIRDVRVIFNAYDIKTVFKIADNSIKLNPYVQMYYNEDNHSKIISNGRHMYIGSANYTGYSKDNYEVGVEINDENSIDAIENQVFQHLYEYKIIISDPVQPIVTFFTLILEEYNKAMEWVEWFFKEAEKGVDVRENDIDDIGYEFTCEILNVLHTTMTKLKAYIENNTNDFKEEGIPIINYIDSICDQIKDEYSINLGYYSKSSFSGFYEDYLHCMEQYKYEFWMESMIDMGHQCICHEREILSRIETVLKMLLYLKIKWINDFTGEYKQKFKIREENCLRWLITPSYVISALEFLS